MSAEEEDGAGGIPEWVVTFGDMMSLLLTFFIMLVSLSEIKQEEMFQAMVESMRQQFGHDSSTASLSPGNIRPRTAQMARLSSMGRAMRANIMQGGNKVEAPVGDEFKVRSIRQGDRTNVGTVLTFEPHKSELTTEHLKALARVQSKLGGKPQRIEVRGHTSRRPADDKYRDNWDLAYERCRAVTAELHKMEFDLKRIRISVAGEHEPVTADAQSRLLHKNDRVEIFLLDELAESLRKDNQRKRK